VWWKAFIWWEYTNTEMQLKERAKSLKVTDEKAKMECITYLTSWSLAWISIYPFVVTRQRLNWITQETRDLFSVSKFATAIIYISVSVSGAVLIPGLYKWMNRRGGWLEGGGTTTTNPSRPASDIPVVARWESRNYRPRELEEGIKGLPVQINKCTNYWRKKIVFERWNDLG
jgi:hypothetical protein